MNALTRFDPEILSASAAHASPVHDVYSLTRGGNLAQLVLDGKVYQLRITRAGKLILTK